jgi:hypothetical protein
MTTPWSEFHHQISVQDNDIFGLVNGQRSTVTMGIREKHALTASSASLQQELMVVDLHIWRSHKLGTLAMLS